MEICYLFAYKLYGHNRVLLIWKSYINSKRLVLIFQLDLLNVTELYAESTDQFVVRDVHLAIHPYALLTFNYSKEKGVLKKMVNTAQQEIMQVKLYDSLKYYERTVKNRYQYFTNISTFFIHTTNFSFAEIYSLIPQNPFEIKSNSTSLYYMAQILAISGLQIRVFEYLGRNSLKAYLDSSLILDAPVFSLYI